MIGHPKYKKGDVVEFTIGKDNYSGTIEIVDAYGVFEDNTDVHYDILGMYKGELTLIKHCKEKFVIRKIGDDHAERRRPF